MTQGYKRSSTKLGLAHGSGSSQSIRATWAATDFIEGPLDAPAIVLIEYDLPYHAAVILLPEYPFELQNKIRAVSVVRRELTKKSRCAEISFEEAMHLFCSSM